MKRPFGVREEESNDYYKETTILNFFHRCANGQKRKRPIFSLQNGSDFVKGTPDLVAHATSFYEELFGPQQMSHARLRDDASSVSECLHEADRIDMDMPFTEEEVKNVVDQMEKNKAAGPNVFLLNSIRHAGK
jgi:hypothetical protein